MATAVKPLRLDGRSSAANVEVCGWGRPPDHTHHGRSDRSAPARLGVTSLMTRPPVPRARTTARVRSRLAVERGAPPSRRRCRRAGTDRTRSRPAARPRAGRSAAASVPSTDHCITARPASGFHALEQQRGSDLAARSNAEHRRLGDGAEEREATRTLAAEAAPSAVTASHVYSRGRVLPRDGKRGPFGFSRWGRGTRFGEASERSEARGSPRVSDRSLILSSIPSLSSAARRTAYASIINIIPPHHLPSRPETRRTDRQNSNISAAFPAIAVCLRVVPTAGTAVGIPVGTAVGTFEPRWGRRRHHRRHYRRHSSRHQCRHHRGSQFRRRETGRCAPRSRRADGRSVAG